MNTTFLFIGFLACLSSAYADMLGINIELSRAKQGQTTLTQVSIQAGSLAKYDRINVSVKAAADDLRNFRFDKDGKFAVIHAKEAIPLADLISIFDAMAMNHIELLYIQIGSGPPPGMDIWKHK
jgi:hypothetical protein